MNRADPGPIPAFLDRTRLIHSYTSLHTYHDVCPHQYWHRYILKDLPFEKTEAMEYGNKVHTAMELRVGAKKPLHPDFAHWEPYAVPFETLGAKCEQKLGLTDTGKACDFWAKDVWLRGKVDVDVTVLHRTFIADWKTGNSKYEDRFELDVGALLLHAQNPELREIKGHYIWLKDNRIGETYDLSNTAETWRKVRDITQRIERDRARGEFEKRQGPLCGWCDVLKCEHNRKGRK